MFIWLFYINRLRFFVNLILRIGLARPMGSRRWALMRALAWGYTSDFPAPRERGRPARGHNCKKFIAARSTDAVNMAGFAAKIADRKRPVFGIIRPDLAIKAGSFEVEMATSATIRSPFAVVAYKAHSAVLGCT